MAVRLLLQVQFRISSRSSARVIFPVDTNKFWNLLFDRLPVKHRCTCSLIKSRFSMFTSAGLQYVFTSKSSFDLCRRRRPLSLLAPAGFKHNFPDMGGLYGAIYNVWCNRQISHASRAIPNPNARCIVRNSRRERGIATASKVAATPRGPHAGGCKPHIKACLNTCSTACRSRYFSRPQNAFILAYSGILDIPPARLFHWRQKSASSPPASCSLP